MNKQITLEKIRNERAIADIPDIIKRILAFLLQGHPPYILLCPKLFSHLRRRGIPVWFLNVQTEEELEIAIKAGATAVLTDKVQWLNETMKRRNWRFKELYE
jgi:glycerophosphoryl diester phosphodiesterase